MIEQLIQRLKNRRILILGFGREGRSTLQFILDHRIDCHVTIADAEVPDEQWLKLMRKHRIKGLFGSDYLHWPEPFELIIKSPGIPSRNIPKVFYPIISSQTDLFLENFGSQTIGITGTKGKSTTSSLIHHLLKASGRVALLTGNIGIPCFDITGQIEADSMVVFEISAHQLEFVHHSPHIGVLLNIFPEHLDHFGQFESYTKAKLNILAHMQVNDFAIVHSSLQQYTNHLIEGNLEFYDQFQINLPDMPMRGEHFNNLARAALLAGQIAGVGLEQMLPALSTFEPLAHRLEPLGPYDGVYFINDSIATVPQATIAAIEAWKPDFLLLGGFDRGIDYNPITEALKVHNISHILLTGEAGYRMSKLIARAFPEKKLHFFDHLEEAFEIISTLAKVGQVVLLSPAAASYDRYKNFEHRGDHFRRLAKSFKRKTPMAQHPG